MSKYSNYQVIFYSNILITGYEPDVVKYKFRSICGRDDINLVKRSNEQSNLKYLNHLELVQPVQN